MSVSVRESFTQNFGRWFHDTAIPTLIKWLHESKNCAVTSDELQKLFDLPIQQGTPFPVMSAPSPMGAGNGIGGTLSTKVPGETTASKKRAPKVSTGETCIYKFKKGDKEGQFCGKNAFAYSYCKACLTKNDSKEEMKTRGITPEMIEKAKNGESVPTTNGGGTGINTIPNANKPIFVPGVPNNGAPQPYLREVDKANKLFVLENAGIKGAVIHELAPGQQLCIGILRANDPNTPVPLTPDEIKYVESVGYKYWENKPAPQQTGSPGAVISPPASVPPPAMVPPPNMNMPPGMSFPPAMVPPPGMQTGMVLPPPMMGNGMNRLPPQVNTNALPDGAL